MAELLAAAHEREESGGKRLALIALASAVTSTAVGFAVGSRWALPILNVLFIYPFYIRLLAGGSRRQAVALALLWAVFLSEAVIVGTYIFPRRAEAVTLRGAEYRDEMFSWVATGEGKESTPSEFIPEHVMHFGIFCVLAAATGGAGALLMGAVLLNYMNFYVGALVLEARHPALTLLLGWQPYAILRVVAYILVATVMAEVFLGVTAGKRLQWRRLRAYAMAGVAGVIVDIMVKSLVAPLWSRMVKWTSGL